MTLIEYVDRIALKDFKHTKVSGVKQLSQLTGSALLTDSEHKEYLLFVYQTAKGWQYFIPSESHVIGFKLFFNLYFDNFQEKHTL